MSEPEPEVSGDLVGGDVVGGDVVGGDVVGGDVLAEKLLAVQRLLAGLNADSDVRIRLNLRFMAICTSLKTPGASRVRGLRRLDRLMADAELAQGSAATRFDETPSG